MLTAEIQTEGCLSLFRSVVEALEARPATEDRFKSQVRDVSVWIVRRGPLVIRFEAYRMTGLWVLKPWNAEITATGPEGFETKARSVPVLGRRGVWTAALIAELEQLRVELSPAIPTPEDTESGLDTARDSISRWQVERWKATDPKPAKLKRTAKS